MIALLYQFKPLLKQSVFLTIGITAMLCAKAPAQKQPERFWLAGRYDGNRVIVYFDAVKFNGTVPATAKRMVDPAVGGFFGPVELPSDYIAQFLKLPGAEHFALGDKFDLLLDYGTVATVTLTTLVGSEGDEGTGNDSFIGALVTVNEQDLMYLSKDIYVLRPHRELAAGKSKPAPNPNAVCAGIQGEPVQFDIQKQILALLNERIKSTATQSERQQAENISPTFVAQAFRLADGTLRYYARVAWSSGEEQTESWKTVYALGAWIAPSPTLHILALEQRTSLYAGLVSVLPTLINVVDLGGGRTGLVTETSGEDSHSLDLVEYRDGVSLRDMRSLQSIGAGE
ncbi:MAG TPA: hypothetical protein VFF50_11530 [Candidatus Deferrimicrobiaceae bacterium]|nr:hypothetical protein [Candidatus Deferrimicrobiaceae bacterium]